MGLRAFLLMPFDPDLEWLRDEIAAAGESVDVEVSRADDIFAPGIIIDQVKAAILSADVVIAVCTGRNANVFYELGIAEHRHEPILVAESNDDLPFDVQHFRAQFYGQDRANLRARIAASIKEAITASTRPVPAATESEVGEDFWLEPGAPTFRVGPGVDAPTADTVKLLMTFAQTSGDEVTPVIEWSGANVDPSRPLMMPQNQPPGARYQKYQLKPALARPALPKDEVTFDIRFRWRGATRQYRWSWPLFMREKGILGMHNVGENTLEPRERTTLD